MVKYGEACSDDSECKSNICEMTYDKINNPKGRFCVIQSQKWGKECFINSDCVSNRCELTKDKYGAFVIDETGTYKSTPIQALNDLGPRTKITSMDGKVSSNGMLMVNNKFYPKL